ncbi:P-loop containing nucleoside triphosphate hydrolase [Pseudocohnilembus persalinus]|uniref:p-loop containing nucleoside triphosphate hydrolase n=1 Tax=Pseudocohnilembus persalinus TaxID=266149 RepID=A0A0V0QXP2_PSEPJ|nr:P-loop containing nucleoside triphosphate hydrolase [Pseudocohnilembus persalinus]|eukprot:KRX06861.1 P-loop containing nucleoside triphosphate hydrolase [Pseudocohnilembus persalinus]
MIQNLKNLKLIKNLTQNKATQQFSTETQQTKKQIFYNGKIYDNTEDLNGNILEIKNQISHSLKLKQSQAQNGQQEKLFQVQNTNKQNTQTITLALLKDVTQGLIDYDKVNIRDGGKLTQIKEIQGNLELNMDRNGFQGQVIDFRGNVLENIDMNQYEILDNDVKKENQVFKLDIFKNYKIRERRVKNEKHLFSGNMAIDFTNPIAKGHVTMLKGKPKSGKTYFMQQVMKQHLSQSGKYLNGISKNGVYGIYCTNNINDAKKLQKLLLEAGLSQFTIYCQNSGSLSENFFLPYSALAQANHLRQFEKRDVVFMFDNCYDHFFNELNIFHEVQQPFSPVSILKNLFTCSGNFKDSGSLSVFMAFDEDNYKFELEKEANKFVQEAESLSDNLIDFDLKEGLILPKLKYNIKSHCYREIHQNELFFQIQKNLMTILKELEEHKHSVSMKKQLGIMVEPWDHYLYYDSQYFNKLLLTNKYLNPIEQIIFMKFIIQVIKTEMASQFKDNQSQLMEQYFAFCEEFRDFEDEMNIFEYVETLLQRQQPEYIMEHINRLFELFVMHLKMNDKLHPYKNDYLI